MYRQEITDRLSRIFLSLLDMLGSKKFLASIAAGLSGWYQTGDIRYFYGALLAFAAAQGLADIGKEAEQIKQDG